MIMAIKMKAQEIQVTKVVQKALIRFLVFFLLGYAFGSWNQHYKGWLDQEEWMQISQEACDM